MFGGNTTHEHMEMEDDTARPEDNLKGPWPLTQERIEQIEFRIDLAETRKSSLESLSAVTTFIAGFALADLAAFSAKEFGSNGNPRAHIYCALMAFVVATTVFIAIVGIFIVFTITSVQLHDKAYLKNFKDNGEETDLGGSEGGVYKLINDMLGYDWKNAKSEADYDERRRRFPYSYTFMMGTCDFGQWPSWWPSAKPCKGRGLTWRGNAYCKALLVLPLSIVAYLAAVVVSATRDAPFEIFVGLTVVMVTAAVPMVRVCDQYIQIALW